MAIVRMKLVKGYKPPLKSRVRAFVSRFRPVVYDEDCPELTEEELKKFRPVNPEAREAWLKSRKQKNNLNWRQIL